MEHHIGRIMMRGTALHRGSYCTPWRLCSIRKLSTREDSRALALFGYAAIIIHEATHGMLDAQRFPYWGANRRRIERICFSEHCRFLAKFPELVERIPAMFGTVLAEQTAL